MGLKEIAKQVRKELKAEFPKCRFSVTTKHFSGGQELTVELMKAPQTPFANLDTITGRTHKGTNAQLNHYYITQDRDGNWISNGYYLTEEAAQMLKRIVEIANRKNWNNSDSMVDYFDVNYWFHLGIGKYNKPFVII